MELTDLYNSAKNTKGKITKSLSNLFGPTTFVRQEPPEPVYILPKVIPEQHRNLFTEQAKRVGITPDEFALIARREQGPNTTLANVKLIGGKDPLDRGVMMVNKQNDPLIKKNFKTEYGREYNPNSSADSIIAARMVLEDNKRQFEQMKKNGTYTNPYTNQDLLDSYNLGVGGLVKAKSGDVEKKKRLERYQKAGG